MNSWVVLAAEALGVQFLVCCDGGDAKAARLIPVLLAGAVVASSTGGDSVVFSVVPLSFFTSNSAGLGLTSSVSFTGTAASVTFTGGGSILVAFVNSAAVSGFKVRLDFAGGEKAGIGRVEASGEA